MRRLFGRTAGPAAVVVLSSGAWSNTINSSSSSAPSPAPAPPSHLRFAASAPMTMWSGIPSVVAASSAHVARRFITMDHTTTPNPECMRFYSMELSFLGAGQTMDMPNAGHAYKSPLAEMLFGIEGVKALYFADEYMTVTKEPGAQWDALIPMVNEAVIAFAESGVNILSEQGEKEVVVDDSDTEPQLWDDEVVLAIKELLAARIRPMLRGDGGNCRFSGFDDGVVHVLLEGACKSCPSSGSTLKNGIERMLMHWIPEVLEVVEVDGDYYFDYERRQEEERREFEKKQQAAAAATSATAAGGDVPIPPPPASPAA